MNRCLISGAICTPGCSTACSPAAGARMRTANPTLAMPSNAPGLGLARSGSEHPVSGIGTWDDDVLTDVPGWATPNGTRLTTCHAAGTRRCRHRARRLRRFIHRSIREHLVADHARLPARPGGRGFCSRTCGMIRTGILGTRGDRHAPPARPAIARIDLPRHEVHRLPGDLSVIDARVGFPRLLARVAAESSQTDWSAEIAEMIGQARIELARSGRTGDLGGAAHWATSNRIARDVLLGLLPTQSSSAAADLLDGVVQLAPTPEDKRQAREALLSLLTRETNAQMAYDLAAHRSSLADGPGQAPGPRGIAQLAGSRDQQLYGARDPHLYGARAQHLYGPHVAASAPARPRWSRTSAGSLKRCSPCWQTGSMGRTPAG